MVTMSNFIQFQQSLRGIDPDLPVRDVDIDADINGQRNQDLAARPVDHQPASARASFDLRHLADGPTVGRFDRAPDELMLVVGAGPERLQRVFRNPQLLPREPLDVLNPIEPGEADDRTPVLHAHRGDRQLLLAAIRLDPDDGACGESLLDEIRFGIDDDLAFQAVGPADAPHERHLLPSPQVPSSLSP